MVESGQCRKALTHSDSGVRGTDRIDHRRLPDASDAAHDDRTTAADSSADTRKLVIPSLHHRTTVSIHCGGGRPFVELLRTARRRVLIERQLTSAASFAT